MNHNIFMTMSETEQSLLGNSVIPLPLDYREQSYESTVGSSKNDVKTKNFETPLGEALIDAAAPSSEAVVGKCFSVSLRCSLCPLQSFSSPENFHSHNMTYHTMEELSSALIINHSRTLSGREELVRDKSPETLPVSVSVDWQDEGSVIVGAPRSNDHLFRIHESEGGFSIGNHPALDRIFAGDAGKVLTSCENFSVLQNDEKTNKSSENPHDPAIFSVPLRHCLFEKKSYTNVEFPVALEETSKISEQNCDKIVNVYGRATSCAPEASEDINGQLLALTKSVTPQKIMSQMMGFDDDDEWPELGDDITLIDDEDLLNSLDLFPSLLDDFVIELEALEGSGALTVHRTEDVSSHPPEKHSDALWSQTTVTEKNQNFETHTPDSSEVNSGLCSLDNTTDQVSLATFVVSNHPQTKTEANELDLHFTEIRPDYIALQDIEHSPEKESLIHGKSQSSFLENKESLNSDCHRKHFQQCHSQISILSEAKSSGAHQIICNISEDTFATFDSGCEDFLSHDIKTKCHRNNDVDDNEDSGNNELCMHVVEEPRIDGGSDSQEAIVQDMSQREMSFSVDDRLCQCVDPTREQAPFTCDGSYFRGKTIYSISRHLTTQAPTHLIKSVSLVDQPKGIVCINPNPVMATRHYNDKPDTDIICDQRYNNFKLKQECVPYQDKMRLNNKILKINNEKHISREQDQPHQFAPSCVCEVSRTTRAGRKVKQNRNREFLYVDVKSVTDSAEVFTDPSLSRNVKQKKLTRSRRQFDHFPQLLGATQKQNNIVLSSDCLTHESDIAPFNDSINTSSDIPYLNRSAYDDSIVLPMEDGVPGMHSQVNITLCHYDTEADEMKDKSVWCYLCLSSFYLQSALEAHLKSDHAQWNTRYTCTACDDLFETEDLFRSHWHEIHGRYGRATYACYICEHTFKCEHSYNKHLKILHPKYKMSCYVCEEKFVCAKSLRNHLSIHTNRNVFACPHCPKKYWLRCSFNRHFRKHCEDYVCTFCRKRCSSKSNFKLHLQSHDGNDSRLGYGTRLRCNYCGDFRNQKTVDLLYHCDAGHHKLCLSCHKGFYKRYRLINTTHHDEGLSKINVAADDGTATFTGAPTLRSREVCPHCSTSVLDLVRHVRRVHRQPKVHCPVCNAVVKKDSLQGHKDRMHGRVSSVTCDHCGKVYKSALSLREHLNNVKNKIKTVLEELSL